MQHLLNFVLVPLFLLISLFILMKAIRLFFSSLLRISCMFYPAAIFS